MIVIAPRMPAIMAAKFNILTNTVGCFAASSIRKIILSSRSNRAFSVVLSTP